MSIEPAKRVIAGALNTRSNDAAVARCAGFDRSFADKIKPDFSSIAPLREFISRSANSKGRRAQGQSAKEKEPGALETNATRRIQAGKEKGQELDSWPLALSSLPLSGAEALTILARHDERFDHFGVGKAAAKVVQFLQPEVEARRIGIAPQVTEVFHGHKSCI